MKNKNIALVIVIVLILIAIYFLQSLNVKNTNSNKVQELAITSNSSADNNRGKILINKENKYPKAVELVDPNGYININNITIKELIGKKVILVDFWTYSCINCIRTIPYINSWYEKYKDQGLEIIGVHSPEFEFEKDYSNVLRAVQKFGIKYPVVQDNNHYTWEAYKNNYWPRKYLIDIDGYIVYDHIGEGDYSETEQKIQDLLLERSKVLGENIEMNKTVLTQESTFDFTKIRTPEIYFGWGFFRGNFGNKEGLSPNNIVNYTLPIKLEKNSLYLEGNWKNNLDNMELVNSNGKVVLIYDAKIANIVASATDSVKVDVLLDNNYHKTINISGSELYSAATADDYGIHKIEININSPGFKIYTFTFG